MTSSGSSSGRSRALRASLAAALLATACGGATPYGVPDPPAPGKPTVPATRIALYPPFNLSGSTTASKELEQDLELALRSRRMEIVGGDAVRRALASRRIRHTGGLDAGAARAVREELGVDAVLIPTVLIDDPAFPPRLALDLRMVSTGDRPEILWQSGVARSGVDSPGLLNTGIIHTMAILRGQVLNQLGDALAAYLAGKVPAPAGCGAIKPRVAYRSRSLDGGSLRTVAVLPFVNQTRRRNAADAVSLELIRELLATGRFRMVEPGAVRAEMLSRRIIVEGGASLDTARAMGQSLEADLLLAGFVRDYQDLPPFSGPPSVEVTIYGIDGRTGEVAWWSNSRSVGTDGVFFFGIGYVSTAAELACGVGRGVAERMAGGRGAPVAETPDPRAKAAQDPPQRAPDSEASP
jgi:hypothetical protein